MLKLAQLNLFDARPLQEFLAGGAIWSEASEAARNATNRVTADVKWHSH